MFKEVTDKLEAWICVDTKLGLMELKMLNKSKPRLIFSPCVCVCVCISLVPDIDEL